MKFIKDNIVLLLLFGIVIVMLFRRSPSPDKKMFEAAIQAKEEAIAAKDEFISHLKSDNVKQDETISDYRRQDSLLTITIINNKSKYASNDKKGKDIITAVNSLDREQLRRELSSY
jgi:hypothetical protein